MRGRIAVVAGGEGFSARFSWTQRADALDLRIRGPLGVGAMAIRGDGDKLSVLARGAQAPVMIADPETELPSLLGWWVPVRSVPSWLLGVPDTAYPATESFDGDGRLSGFQQRGWQVEVLDYQLASEVLIPAQLQLDHGDLRVKLIVDSWSIDKLD
jgi:outer membrane lipoprotein LolB